MNRALAFSAGDPGQRQAIRVRIDSVPATNPNLDFLVGSQWWLQPKVAVSEKSVSVTPTRGHATFWTSRLGCEPFFADWHGVCLGAECEGGLRDGVCVAGVCAAGTNDGEVCSSDADCAGSPCTEDADCEGGIINVVSEAIVPGASYTVSVVGEGCDLSDANTFAQGSGMFTTSSYGNVVGTCGPTGCTVPDNGLTGIADALAGLLVFSGSPNRPRKMRTELEPSKSDFFAAISDVLQSLGAFTGRTYPYLQCHTILGGTRRCFGGPTNGQACQTSVDCQLPLCAVAAHEQTSSKVP